MEMARDCTEAEWKFEICHALRLAGVPFRLEFSTPAGFQDIAITSDGWLHGIIETKRRANPGRSFQIVRYESLGVPLLICWPGHDMTAIVRLVADWISSRSGRSLAEIVADPSVVRRWRRPRSARARLLLAADESLNLRE